MATETLMLSLSKHEDRRTILSTPSHCSQPHDHAVLGGLAVEGFQAGQHVGAHMGDDEPLRAQLGQVIHEGAVVEVKLDRLVVEIGFRDQQVGALGGGDQAVGPLGVAGVGDDLAGAR